MIKSFIFPSCLYANINIILWKHEHTLLRSVFLINMLHCVVCCCTTYVFGLLGQLEEQVGAEDMETHTHTHANSRNNSISI